MLSLIQNEVMKILYKKKMILIFILLLLFVGLFSYGDQYIYEKTISKFEQLTENSSYNWVNLANQQIDELKDRLNSPYIPDSGIKSIEIEISQLEYFIDNDINPITPSAARFSAQFVEQSIHMFLPLLIIILAADLVSGEFSTGTIKVLMTRAVPRWKILLSKYIALLMMTTLVLLLIAIVSTVVSGIYFNLWGFQEPVATGFNLIDSELNASSVIMISRLKYMLLIYSLAWFVSIVLASIVLMFSVLFRSTATAIGIIMASLIGGQFLQFFLSEWNIVKYFFVSNLDLIKYLTGSYQPIEGMHLGFSIGVLSAWAILSITVSFVVFIRKDILV